VGPKPCLEVLEMILLFVLSSTMQLFPQLFYCVTLHYFLISVVSARYSHLMINHVENNK
jgi:hypothetical protein